MATWYRIVQEQYAASAFSGEGARRWGGRWNPPGTPAVYLAASRALAALEILVHAPREALRTEWCCIAVEVPDEWIAPSKGKRLPADWRAQPSSPDARSFGAKFLQNAKSLPALQLPSVIIPEEQILMLNPAHAFARDLSPGKPRLFTFDPRLA